MTCNLFSTYFLFYFLFSSTPWFGEGLEEHQGRTPPGPGNFGGQPSRSSIPGPGWTAAAIWHGTVQFLIIIYKCFNLTFCDNSCVIKHPTICLSPYVQDQTQGDRLVQMKLPNTDVQVSKTKYQRLNHSKASLFTQELLMLVFGRDWCCELAVWRGKVLQGDSPNSSWTQNWSTL